jgi:hypothetical protein
VNENNLSCIPSVPRISTSNTLLSGAAIVSIFHNAIYQRWRGIFNSLLGPVNTTDASANERPGVQGKADDDARTGRPGKKDNAGMRAETFVPAGLPA